MVILSQRMKQLGWAMMANFKKIDEQVVIDELSKEEQNLFFAMSKVDQHHALRVYQTVKKIWNQGQLESNVSVEPDCYDYKMLRIAALLHDSGRQKGEFSIIHKILAVIYDKFLDKKPQNERQRIINSIVTKKTPRFLYIYYHHPTLSKKKLEALECDALLVYLTEHHHSETIPQGISLESNQNYEYKNSIRLLEILKKADSMN